MARITDVFMSGTLENVVLYRRMGTNCSRMKRSHIKQTAPTKARGLNFGIAARAAKGLRNGLQEVMPNPTDRSMQSRFSGAIAKWLGVHNAATLPPCDAPPYIGSFQFTGGAGTERCKVPISVSHPSDNGITVRIAAFNPVGGLLAAPAGTVSVTFTITVAGCMLTSGVATGSETHGFTVQYNDVEIPAQVLEFHLPMPAGSLTVTAARLTYHDVKHNVVMKNDNPAFIPAGVINARYA